MLLVGCLSARNFLPLIDNKTTGVGEDSSFVYRRRRDRVRADGAGPRLHQEKILMSSHDAGEGCVKCEKNPLIQVFYPADMLS